MEITPIYYTKIKDGTTGLNAASGDQLIQRVEALDSFASMQNSLLIEHDGYFRNKDLQYGSNAAVEISGKIKINYVYPTSTASDGGNVLTWLTETLDSADVSGSMALDNGQAIVAIVRSSTPGGNLNYVGPVSTLSSMSPGQVGLINIANIVPQKNAVILFYRGGSYPSTGRISSSASPIGQIYFRGMTKNRIVRVESLSPALATYSYLAVNYPSYQLTLDIPVIDANFYVATEYKNAFTHNYFRVQLKKVLKRTSAPHLVYLFNAQPGGTIDFTVLVEQI